MRRDSALLALTVMIVAATFFTPAQRDLFVGDETKYGRILWEMRETGSLLVPTLEGRPYSHKPPVHFWLVYLLTYLFGVTSTWPFVIPSLLTFVLMLWLVHRIAREFFSAGAMMAVFIFSTFYLAWGLSQTARMDMSFVLLTSLAVLNLYRFFNGSKRGLILAALLVGIAILVKGPMAAVMVAALLVIESIRRRRWPRGNYLLAILLAGGIPLLWLVPALLQGGPAYARELIVEQNVGRAVNAWVHREPPWWYLERAPVTFFPWFFLTVFAIVALYRSDAARGSSLTAQRFCVSWLLTVVVPYSLLSSKLDVYMLPALVPAALLCTAFVESFADSRQARLAIGTHRVVLIFFALFFISIPLIAPRFVTQIPELEALRRPMVAGLFWTTAAVALAAAIFGHGSRVAGLESAGQDPGPATPDPRSPLVRSVISLGFACIYPLIYMAVFLMPIVNDASSTRPLVRALMRQTRDGERIGLWHSPHLWTGDMPDSYRRVEYLGRDRLRQSADKPLVIATRSDRAVHLGRELLEQYRKVDQLRMRGKDFDVYRRR